MRKTSHDGGDSTSITSGFENETRKTSMGIIKTKRNSIKRKVQNFSHESDDTVIEPLLQIDKTETINRSAKYLLSKSKTDSLNERENNICSDNKFENIRGGSKPIFSTGTTTTSNSNITIHNHMNINVFGGHEGSQVTSPVKCPVLVEINGGKATGNLNQTSSIFTTAKIHADSITKTMTPMQVTPLPILSTVEGNTVKVGISPDYSQVKNAVPSTSSNISKSISSFGRSNIGQSDPSTESIIKNLNTVLDSRPLETSTKSESKLQNKSYDTQKITSVTGIKNTETGNKVMLQPQSSINTISEKKSKPPQGQRDLGSMDRFQLRDTETKIEMISNVSLPNQTISNVKTVVPKQFGVAKIEDKNVSSTGGIMKQLQRQKTIVEDSKDADTILKNVNEVDKLSTSKQKDSLSKSESTVIAHADRKQSSIVIESTKSKDKVTQSTALKKDSLIEKEEAKEVAKETAKEAAKEAAKEVAKEVSTPITKNTSLVSDISKEIDSKSSVPPTHSGSQIVKADLMRGKKLSENQTNKVDNTMISAVSAKEIVSKSTVDIPSSTSQVITSFKSDISKDKGSTFGSQKSVIDNSSLSAYNKIISKPAATIQPAQAASTLKSDFIKKDHDAGSSRIVRSGNESLLVKPTVTKDDDAKSTTIVQPSLSLTKLKSDSVKGKRPETGNFTKEVDQISSNVVSVKSPVTTNQSSLIKVNSTKVLETTPVLTKSLTTKVHTTLSDNINLKSTIDSQQHKIVKSEASSIPSAKAITTNSFLPTSTNTVTKSDETSKLTSSVTNFTNPVQTSSKTELSNQLLAP